MAANNDALCWECVSDAVLCQWLRENGRVGKCSFCGQRRIVCPIAQVAEKIDEAIRSYRARIINESNCEKYVRDPARNIGPPPPHLTRAGRMNPAGIPVFYGAFSEEVAIAEVRPPVGAIVAVGRFSLLRPVRLLDVSFLPLAYHEESIFSPAYDRLRNKVTFLEKFHRHISRPVLPSDEALAYLPTQAVAAYVANIMKLDGLIYGSTQIGAKDESQGRVNRDMCNVALFGPASRVEGVNYKQVPAEDTETESMFPDLGHAIGPQSRTTQPTKSVHTEGLECSDDRSASPALRADPEPSLFKIRSVRVETSSIFVQLSQDGSVVINDYEDDDDD